ncbi:hypothetical protein EAI30_15605 [Romboutsia ilealis]|uniref:Uncharacterized protein n=1 Tax=Romboutsia faecis TaxID=2764597 RepID=A0ABR7JKK7_9FIRM|nr:hypothetical protein [Romboutsia faecis]MBC5995151.1 hypothetical protein [Romboutsia faecis]MRN26044.1 hypothetical protein [Romboutsia ilealis]
MVIFTLISLSIISLCLIYFLSMVCIQLNRIMSINLLLGMDVTKLYSDEDLDKDEDYIDSLIKSCAMFIYKTTNKFKKHI